MAEIWAAMSVDTFGFAIIGIALGIFFGALPGFGGGAAMAISLPIAITLSPLNAMVFLISIYGGVNYGDSLPACLIGVPGSPGSAPTAIDGFPMTRQGRASEALAAGAVGSCAGATISVLAFIFLAPILARFALKFGPPEFFMLVVFGLTVLASIDARGTAKTLFAGGFGICLALVGADPYWGQSRMTFGAIELYEGIPFIPALLGLFCVSQMMLLIDDRVLAEPEDRQAPTMRGIIRGMGACTLRVRIILQSSLVGTVVGALPGAGATIAAFLSYTLAKNTSSNPAAYGKGERDAVIASEAGNSSTVGGALIPTFALGIPGSASTAILLGVMMYMGLRPGPRLFLEQMPLIQTLVIFLLFGCLMIGLFGAFAAKYFYQLTRVPLKILVPCTIATATLGAYTNRGEIFDIGVMLAMGLLGYILVKLRYPLSAVVLGMVLGPLAERYFIQSVELVNWDLRIFFASPICIALWVGIALSLIGSRVLAYRERKAHESAG
ncbi:tripartite tricarboxylate transporter permease [Acuticoccus kandeliae]|uniref:tripartite tricarboxylate transporter permease n=1 Tax=Acuticoccus kandeliae TaxID=2073160 RepID=UPI000D3E1202|nr:tripartite tricarboxylate transporter permease [Acuticoccus kandeliae]